VEIEKASKGRGKAGWRPTFTKDSLLHREFRPFPWLFKRHSVKLMVKEGAKNCINFFPEVEVPSLDKEAIEALMKANTLKAAGNIKTKFEIPLLFYLLMFMLLAGLAFDILVSTGRIYI